MTEADWWALVPAPLRNRPEMAYVRDDPALPRVLLLGDSISMSYTALVRRRLATVRGNVTIDWTLRENVRAHLRRLVRGVLRKHGHPPDKQEKATRTVLDQAEALSANWAG